MSRLLNSNTRNRDRMTALKADGMFGVVDMALTCLPGPLRKRMAQTELSKSMNEFLTKLQDDLKEAMNTMMCTKCEGKHRYITD